MHSIAIAPAHHDLVLKSCKNSKRVVGRLTFEAVFKQIPVVSLRLREVRLELGELHAKVDAGSESSPEMIPSSTIVKHIGDSAHQHFRVSPG